MVRLHGLQVQSVFILISLFMCLMELSIVGSLFQQQCGQGQSHMQQQGSSSDSETIMRKAHVVALGAVKREAIIE